MEQFAAWLGLVPRQNSRGGKDRLGGISKMGDRYLRHLLVVGATAVVRYTRRKTTTVSLWANRLLQRKPARLVTVAGRPNAGTAGRTRLDCGETCPIRICRRRVVCPI